MQDTTANLSPDYQLLDRDPSFRFDDTTTMEKVQNSSKEYKEMIETMEKFQSLTRKQKRKIIKPSFSQNIRKALKK